VSNDEGNGQEGEEREGEEKRNKNDEKRLPDMSL